jgi:hypothetical protein
VVFRAKLAKLKFVQVVAAVAAATKEEAVEEVVVD